MAAKLHVSVGLVELLVMIEPVDVTESASPATNERREVVAVEIVVVVMAAPCRESFRGVG
jgi:hypothetical protein